MFLITRSKLCYLFSVYVLYSLFFTTGQAQMEKRGLIQNVPGAFLGYTLVSPLGSTMINLIDMKEEVVHDWESEY
jgi:hypothetical protein